MAIQIKNTNVSVIIPAYNVEKCLKRAIISVLGQKPSPDEVIIINDGSTDKTEIISKEFSDQVKYLKQSNQGPAAARNKGISVATGDYVAFLDADDYWLPGFLKATVAFLEDHPKAVAVSTGWKIQPLKGPAKTFPSTSDINLITNQPKILDNFFSFWGEHDHVRTGTVVIRRALMREDSIQREDLRISEDLEFWAYLATLGPWGFIPDAYWFGDSARVAAQDGWLKKYQTRRKKCPTVEMWQQRIINKIKDEDQPGFRQMRGRVASSYLQNMVLAGMHTEAKKSIANYGSEMPGSWLTKIMKLGYKSGKLGWLISCIIVHIREYQKSITLTITSKIKRTTRS